LKVFCKKSWRI